MNKDPLEQTSGQSRLHFSSYKLLWLILLGILLLAGFLHLYRLPELTSFRSDQGRDALAARAMIETHQPALLGPGSAVGKFKRGPAYYYLLLPFFVVGEENPLMGAAASAFFDLAAIVLLFLVGRDFFNEWVGLGAAALYAVSAVPVFWGRYFWNPSPLPFFALLLLFALQKICAGDERYLLILVPTWSVAWQIHDPPLFFLPLFLIAWLWFRPRIRIQTYILAFALGLITLLPFLFYEVQHEFVNLRAMFAGFLQASGSGGKLIENAAANIAITFQLLDAMLPGAGILHLVVIALALLGLARVFYEWRGAARRNAQLFSLYLALPLLYALWPVPPETRYMTIVLPLPFLLLGLGLDTLRRPNRYFALATAGVTVLLVLSIANTTYASYRSARPGDHSLSAETRVADAVIEQSNNKPFQFRLIASYQNHEAYDSPYQYLLAWLGHAPSNRTDVDTFVLYDPETEGDAADYSGTTINGVKIVHLQAPRQVGPDLIKNGSFVGVNGKMTGWYNYAPEGTQNIPDPKGEGLLQVGVNGNDDLKTTQVVRLEGDRQYLIRFRYRNQLARGDLRVYFIVEDAAGNSLDTFPVGAEHGQVFANGALFNNRTDSWVDDSLLVRVPPNGVKAKLWLRNRGIGPAWWDDIQIYQVETDDIPPP